MVPHRVPEFEELYPGPHGDGGRALVCNGEGKEEGTHPEQVIGDIPSPLTHIAVSDGQKYESIA